MHSVYIALGTNLGDREANLRLARENLAEAIQVTGTSRIFETQPWGVVDQPLFLNQVLRGETRLDPTDLLAFLKQIEHEMGRVNSVRYGPRLIDLDILFYDDRVLSSPDLTIPHPRLAERRFVLVPLADLAPELQHPVLHATVASLLSQLPDDGTVSLYLPLLQ